MENRFNESAQFLAGDASHYPAVVIAGVRVLVYVEDGQLVIAANFDESELGEPTPVVVKMSDQTVWTPEVMSVIQEALGDAYAHRTDSGEAAFADLEDYEQEAVLRYRAAANLLGLVIE